MNHQPLTLQPRPASFLGALSELHTMVPQGGIKFTAFYTQFRVALYFRKFWKMVRTLRVKVQILLLVIKMVNAEKKQGYLNFWPCSNSFKVSALNLARWSFYRMLTVKQILLYISWLSLFISYTFIPTSWWSVLLSSWQTQVHSTYIYLKSLP